MNRFLPISSNFIDHKSKLYFSQKELTKILEYYSFGVTRGKWKDYAIQFEMNEAYFHFYRNCSEKPMLSIFKKKQKKNKDVNFQLLFGYNKVISNSTLENLFVFLNRKNIKLIR